MTCTGIECLSDEEIVETALAIWAQLEGSTHQRLGVVIKILASISVCPKLGPDELDALARQMVAAT